jgi:hypothetical protein
MAFRRLDPKETIETVAQLVRRIGERFPGAGLVGVCEELLAIAKESEETAARIARPLPVLRAGVGLVVAAIIAGLGYSISMIDIEPGSLSPGDLVQAVEASLNALALIGAAIFFFVTIENRVKRARALTALHELRSMAHVIDMHQLTKDPAIPGVEAIDTPSSPHRTLSDFELARYLDYCSEMLSLLGKIAALYAQTSADREVTSAVNEVEVLTTGLSSKIWDKIQAIHASHRAD